MMVYLLLYAYATATRCSRAVERRLIEDAAFRMIAAGQAPDHANASDDANLTYEQIAQQILAQATAADAAEDELYGTPNAIRRRPPARAQRPDRQARTSRRIARR